MSDTKTVSPLRQRMIEDMAARKLNPNTQRGHISSCKRFAGWLKRSPDTATPDEVRRFQLHLIESGASICTRNRIMTGVRFLFRDQGAAKAAAGAEPRRGQACSDHGDEPAGASDADTRLWLRTAGGRGGAAAGGRHRQ